MGLYTLAFRHQVFCPSSQDRLSTTKADEYGGSSLMETCKLGLYPAGTSLFRPRSQAPDKLKTGAPADDDNV